MEANSSSTCLIFSKWVSLLLSPVIKCLVISVGHLASPWAIMLNANGWLFSSGLASNLEGSAKEHLQSWLRINICYGWGIDLHIEYLCHHLHLLWQGPTLPTCPLMNGLWQGMVEDREKARNTIRFLNLSNWDNVCHFHRHCTLSPWGDYNWLMWDLPERVGVKKWDFKI